MEETIQACELHLTMKKSPCEAYLHSKKLGSTNESVDSSLDSFSFDKKSDDDSVEITEKTLKLFIPSTISLNHESKKKVNAYENRSVRQVLLHVLNKLHRNVQDIVKSDRWAENPLMPLLKKCFGIKEIVNEAKQRSLITFIVSLLSECITLLEIAIDKQTYIEEDESTNRSKMASTILYNIMYEVREELQHSKILLLTVSNLLYVPSLKLIYYLMKTFILSTASLLKSKGMTRERRFTRQKPKRGKFDEFSTRLNKLWEKLDSNVRDFKKPQQSKKKIIAPDCQSRENQRSDTDEFQQLVSYLKESLLNAVTSEKYASNIQKNLEREKHVKERTDLCCTDDCKSKTEECDGIQNPLAFPSCTGENAFNYSLEEIIKSIICNRILDNNNFSTRNAEHPLSWFDVPQNHDIFKKYSHTKAQTLDKIITQNSSYTQFELGYEKLRSDSVNASSTPWKQDTNVDSTGGSNSHVNPSPKMKEPTPKRKNFEKNNLYQIAPEELSKIMNTNSQISCGDNINTRNDANNEHSCFHNQMTSMYIAQSKSQFSQMSPMPKKHEGIPQNNVYDYEAYYNPIIAYSQVMDPLNGPNVEKENTKKDDENKFTNMFHIPCSCQEHNFKGTSGPIYQFFANAAPFQCKCVEGQTKLDKNTEVSSEGIFGNAIKELKRSPEPVISKNDINKINKNQSVDYLSNTEIGTQTEENEQCTCSGDEHKIFIEFDDKYSQVIEEIQSLIKDGDIPLKREPSYIQREPSHLQREPSYVQQEPSYVQQEPSYLQHEPSNIKIELESNKNPLLCDPRVENEGSLHENTPPEAFLCCKCCKCEESDASCKEKSPDPLRIEISAVCLMPDINPLDNSTQQRTGSPPNPKQLSSDRNSSPQKGKVVQFQTPRNSEIKESSNLIDTLPRNPAEVTEPHLSQSLVNQPEPNHAGKSVALYRPEYEALMRKRSDSFTFTKPDAAKVDSSKEKGHFFGEGKILGKWQNQPTNQELNVTNEKNTKVLQSKPDQTDGSSGYYANISKQNESRKSMYGSRKPATPSDLDESSNDEIPKSGALENTMDQMPNASQPKTITDNSKAGIHAPQHGTSNSHEEPDGTNIQCETDSNNSTFEQSSHEPGAPKYSRESNLELRLDIQKSKNEADECESLTSEFDATLDVSDDTSECLRSIDSDWSFSTEDQNDQDLETNPSRCESGTIDKPNSFYSDAESTTTQPSQTEILVMIIESHTEASRLPKCQDEIVPLLLSSPMTNDTHEEHYKYIEPYNSDRRETDKSELGNRCDKIIPNNSSLNSKSNNTCVQNAIKAKNKGTQVTKWNVKLQTAGPKQFNRTDISDDTENRLARHLGLERTKKHYVRS